MRSGTGTGFSRIATVPSGKTGTITGPPAVAGGYTWYPVTFAGYGSGYMAGNYLTPSTPTGPTSTPTRTATAVPGGFEVGASVMTTSSVNLRATPSISGAVRAVIAKGTVGTITGSGIRSGSHTWYQVTIGGRAGYIAGSYLRLSTFTPPTVTNTSTATPSKTATAVVGAIPVGTLVEPTANINVRSCPGTSCTILVMVGKGVGVRIAGAPVTVGSALWYPVTYVGGTPPGWASGAYLKVPSSSPPTAPLTLTATHTATQTATRTPTPSATRTPTRTTTPIRTPSDDYSAGIPAPGEKWYVASAEGTNLPIYACASYDCAIVVDFHWNNVRWIMATGTPIRTDWSTVWVPMQTIDGDEGWVPHYWPTDEFIDYLSATPTATRVPPTSTPTATQTAVPDPGLPGPHYSFSAVFQCSHEQRVRTGPGFGYPTIDTTSSNTTYTMTGEGASADGYVWFPVSTSPSTTAGWVPYTTGCHSPPPTA